MIEILDITIPPEATRADFEALLPLLASGKRRRLERALCPASAMQSLCGELLTRIDLARRGALSPDAFRFRTRPGGKPYCVGTPGLHFNLAHSHQRVVCATSFRELGVDIEALRPIGTDVARRFFAAEEYAALMRIPEPQRRRRFFRLWTLKESYLKAIGKGLRVPLCQVTFGNASSEINVIVKGKPDSRWFCHLYELAPDYIVSVCAQESAFPDRIETVSFDEARRALAPLRNPLM